MNMAPMALRMTIAKTEITMLVVLVRFLAAGSWVIWPPYHVHALKALKTGFMLAWW